jgi:L-aspartate oxidase
MAKDLIPIFPCQHYLMGGVAVDLHSRTSVPGLYAVGECAHTGLHGGNRLASNSLPEALVFSRRAAEDICNTERTMHTSELSEAQSTAAHCCNSAFSVQHSVLREMIQQTMQEACFVFPDREKLPEAARRMRALYEELCGGGYALTREYAEVRSLACMAALILEDALERMNL